MTKARISVNLIPGILLALITAFLLFLVGKSETFSGLVQVIMIIAGMSTIAAFTAFQRFIERGNRNSLIHLSFNEVFVSRSISEGLPEPANVDPKLLNNKKSPPIPWELTVGQLVGVDNSLALAKLRMDIEKELRKVAYENNIDIQTRPLGVIGLANELVNKKLLPTSLLEALKEIISVCNQAVHGTEVSDHTTASVVRVGTQFLERLHLTSNSSAEE
ncbi:MAG: hypothetical protein ACE5I1_14875 [bacterium]